MEKKGDFLEGLLLYFYGLIWAAGATFKAVFAEEGVDYRPLVLGLGYCSRWTVEDAYGFVVDSAGTAFIVVYYYNHSMSPLHGKPP